MSCYNFNQCNNQCYNQCNNYGYNQCNNYGYNQCNNYGYNQCYNPCYKPCCNISINGTNNSGVTVTSLVATGWTGTFSGATGTNMGILSLSSNCPPSTITLTGTINSLAYTFSNLPLRNGGQITATSGGVNRTVTITSSAGCGSTKTYQLNLT